MRSGEMPEGGDRLAGSRYLIGKVWRLTERGWFVAKPDFDAADLVGPNWILADSQTAMPGPVGGAEWPRNVEIGLGLAADPVDQRWPGKGDPGGPPCSAAASWV